MWGTVWEGHFITVSADVKLRCVLYLLSSSASAEMRAMGRLLIGQQHLDVSLCVRAIRVLQLRRSCHAIICCHALSRLQQATCLAWGLSGVPR